MKVELIEKKIPEGIKYPCLMEYLNKSGSGKFIVLMTEKHAGTVIMSDNENRQIGYYTEGWNPNQFKEYLGIVQLSNEWVL